MGTAKGEHPGAQRAPLRRCNTGSESSRLQPRFNLILIAAFAQRQEAHYLPESGLLAADVSAHVCGIRHFRAAAVDRLQGHAPLVITFLVLMFTTPSIWSIFGARL